MTSELNNKNSTMNTTITINRSRLRAEDGSELLGSRETAPRTEEFPTAITLETDSRINWGEYYPDSAYIVIDAELGGRVVNICPPRSDVPMTLKEHEARLLANEQFIARVSGGVELASGTMAECVAATNSFLLNNER